MAVTTRWCAVLAALVYCHEMSIATGQGAACGEDVTGVAIPHGGAGLVADCGRALSDGKCCHPVCDQGYELHGQRCCLEGALDTSAGRTASCDPKPCDASATLPHGGPGPCTATLADGGSCEPTCDPGYTLTGQRTCALGVLTENDAVCNPDSCHPANQPPAGGHSTVGDCTNTLQSGDHCTPACALGYHWIVSGARASARRSCVAGELDDGGGSCGDPDPCEAGKSPSNGVNGDCSDQGKLVGGKLPSGESCNPECGNGYGCGQPDAHGAYPDCVRTCTAGVLKGDAVCSEKECTGTDDPPLGRSSHGNKGDCPPTLASGHSCHPKCDQGFEPQGERTCVKGDLTPNTASCQAKHCSALQIPHSDHSGPLTACGKATEPAKTGENCGYTCNDGYSLGGLNVGNPGPHSADSLKCLDTSVFGYSSANECQPNSCDASTPVLHMKALNDCTSALNSGVTCNPTCNSPFHRSGGRTCTAGVLTKDDAACGNPDPCENNVPKPQHAKSMLNCPDPLPSGKNCTIECDTGYHSKPGGVRSCIAGDFTNTFECLPDDCTGPDVTHTGANAKPGTCAVPLRSGDDCTVLCTDPHDVPEGERTCFAGKLIVNTMKCVRKRCNDAAVHVNTSHYKGNGTCTGILRGDETCYPECDDGWFLKVARKCSPEGGQLSSSGTCSKCTDTECKHDGVCVADPTSVTGGYICTGCHTGYYGERLKCSNINPCTVAADPCKTWTRRGKCNLDESSTGAFNCTQCDRFFKGGPPGDCTFEATFTAWEYTCIIATALSVLPVPFMICRFWSTLDRLNDPYLDDSKKSLGLWGVFMFLFGLLDLVVDFRMIWTLKTCNQDVLLACGIVTFVTTTLMTWHLGYVTLKHIVSRPGGGPAAKRWLGKHVVVGPMVILASSSRLNSMAILRLRICGYQLIGFPDSRDQRYFHFLKNSGIYHYWVEPLLLGSFHYDWLHQQDTTTDRV